MKRTVAFGRVVAVPAATPDSPPSTNTSATDATEIVRSSRVATITRLKMSRPNWSVPNQCWSEGACSARLVLLASGQSHFVNGAVIAADDGFGA